MNITLDYKPQAKQSIMHKSHATEILYGGAAGGGKSHALRMEGLDWCMRVPGIQVYLFRRTNPELEENHIIPALETFPQKICTYKDSKKRFDFVNGSKFKFRHCQYDKDVIIYQGSEIHVLLMDELTHFSETVYKFLRARVRSTITIPDRFKNRLPRIVCASNPGGKGHAFVKKNWVDFEQPMKLKQAPKSEGGMLRQFIPARLTDNQVLMDSDPAYKDRLDGLPPNLRAAWRDGDWDIFSGQVFDNFKYDIHVIKPFKIPHHWKKFRAMDWGSTKPFSIGWYAVDEEGRLFRYREWYGSNGMPNEGLKLDSKAVAEGIIERETYDKRLVIAGPADPAIFAKHDGPSIAEKMLTAGVPWLRGDNDRMNGLQEVYSRFDAYKTDGEKKPMFYIFSNCTEAIKQIPLLVHDERKPEDVDTEQEDHIYDEIRYACMSRPMKTIRPKLLRERISKDTYVPLEGNY